MKKLVLGILCCIWMSVLSASAQCAAKNDAIQPGERLTYELKFNWKFIWVKAGTASYKISSSKYQGKEALRTDLLFQSNSPITNTINDGPVTFELLRSTSASCFDIYPFSYIFPKIPICLASNSGLNVIYGFSQSPRAPNLLNPSVCLSL